jgi:membrane-associated phospholipid phosphatase
MGSPVDDVIPDNQQRIAYWIGLIFHPAVVMLPTLLLVLNDVPFQQALLWTAIIAMFMLIPGFAVIASLQRQQKYTYQRRSRAPIYMVVWISVVTCWVLIGIFKGPNELVVCMATLAVWLPVQLAINHSITKISTHTAVAAGCITALLLLEKLNTPIAITIGLVIVGITAWARVITKNHTLTQVLLGLVVGAGSVMLVFPLMPG